MKPLILLSCQRKNEVFHYEKIKQKTNILIKDF